MLNRIRLTLSHTDKRRAPTMGQRRRSPVPVRSAVAPHVPFGCNWLATVEVF